VEPSLAVTIGSLRLKNPIMGASGTFGYGLEFQDFLDLEALGGFVTKGLSLLPRKGHPPPRIVETPCGMLNAIGLHNVGVEAFLEEKLPALRGLDTAVVCNVFGERIEDYVRLVERLDGQEGVAGLELNVSCPHVERGGVEFGSDPRLLHEVTSACRAATGLPLWVKLTPTVTDILETAQAAVEAGADALSLVNTYRGMAVDLERRRAIPARGVGGLSGPAIKPMALYAVHRVARAVSVPVVGIGGIRNATDVLEFLVAGARAVQVGTMNYVEPGITARLAGEVGDWLASHGVPDINDLVDSLEIRKDGP